jgi:hypothetical protein
VFVTGAIPKHVTNLKLELELELELVTNFDFIRELPNEERSVQPISIPPSPFLHPQSCALELRTWQGSLGSSSTLAFALARTSERPEFRFHVILGLCCLSASWDPIKPNVFHAAGRAHRRQLTILR